MDKGGPRLSVGPILAALEYGSGKSAVTVGKPETPMFEEAMRLAGVNARETVMVGDQLETDIAGARRLGVLPILVTTGVNRKDDLSYTQTKPDFALSCADEIVECYEPGRIKRSKLLTGRKGAQEIAFL